MAAPSGTAMMKATITSAAVTATASCTCGRPSRLASIASTSDSGGSSSGLTMPMRGSTSHAASTRASSASRARMIEAVHGSSLTRHPGKRRRRALSDRRKVSLTLQPCLRRRLGTGIWLTSSSAPA